jgi:hypothetical protein
MMAPYIVSFRTRKISRHDCPYEALKIARIYGPGWRIECANKAASDALQTAMNGKPVFRSNPVTGKPEQLDTKSGQYRPLQGLAA